MLARLVAKIKHSFRRFVYRRTHKMLRPRDGGYGAFGQDIFVAELLGRKKKGVFIDVGANDGVTINNTLFFEKELGWKGVAVEPLPTAYAALCKNRTCHLLNACVANVSGSKPFLEIEGPFNMLSGLVGKYDKRHLARIDKSLRRTAGSKREIHVECVTLPTLAERFGFSEVDFLSLDTEGGELEILRTIDFQRMPVRVISVENNYFTHDIERYLVSQGFECAGSFRADEIYFVPKLCAVAHP